LPETGNSGTSVRLLADGRRALCGDLYGLRLVDLEAGRCLRELAGFQELGNYEVSSIAVSPDQRTALTGTTNGRVLLWDLETGRRLKGIQLGTEQPPPAVEGLCFSPDGRHFYAGVPGLVAGWEVTTGVLVIRYPTRHQQVKALAVSGDGRLLVSCGTSAEVQVQNLAEDRTAQVLRVTGGKKQAKAEVSDVAMTADGRLVVTASPDGRVRVWEVDGGRLLHAVAGPDSPERTDWPMNTVSLSPDGRFAAAGGWDKQVHLLDLRTGSWVGTLPGHAGSIESVHIGGRGRYAVSTGWDGTVRRWELDWELDPGGAA
jgi:WD40 repeat protein